MTTQTVLADIRQPGMEKGFSLSPMGDLVREYNAQDQDLSIFIRSTCLAGKKALERAEVMDRGISLRPQTPAVERFSLETGFWMRTERTIRELQALLNKAAGLVKDRTSTYEIDPHGVLSALLKGSQNLGGILAAWVALSERIHIAQRNFDKYISEYKEEKEEDTEYPTSITYTITCRTSAGIGPKGTTWIQIPSPSSPPVPQYLEEAFPDRPPEDRPATVYYSAQGERREYSVSLRSSRGAGPDFQLPPVSEDERPRKARCRGRSKSPRRERLTRSMSPGPPVADKHPSRRD
ncbi:hypothetical protein B0H14DRAFT_2605577 [Mycena olivaceomarginata]|nr:hypothetical protein B0H14DRAFT_2605577 [Mycena olivaceomarginata]